jgi:hypothetical protein
MKCLIYLVLNKREKINNVRNCNSYIKINRNVFLLYYDFFIFIAICLSGPGFYSLHTHRILAKVFSKILQFPGKRIDFVLEDSKSDSFPIRTN